MAPAAAAAAPAGVSAPCIAVDCRMARHSGVGVHLRSLLACLVAMRPGWCWRLIGPPEPSGIDTLGEIVPLGLPPYSWREPLALRRATRGADLVWSPHYNAAILSAAPLLVTIHDVAPLALPHVSPSRRIAAQAMLQAIRWRADALAFVSDASLRAFTRHVGAPRQPTCLTPNAAGAAWQGVSSTQAEKPRFVAVASLKRHKDLGTLVQAFRRLPEGSAELVLAGRTEGLRDRDEATLRAIAGGTGIRLLGEIGEADLIALVAGATALVAPSRHEGFGLTPLEAMAAGCPTLVSDIAAHREVCADASLYFPAGDVAALAAAMRRVLADPALRKTLRQRGRSRALQFSWPKSAQTLIAMMETILGDRAASRSPP